MSRRVDCGLHHDFAESPIISILLKQDLLVRQLQTELAIDQVFEEAPGTGKVAAKWRNIIRASRRMIFFLASGTPKTRMPKVSPVDMSNIMQIDQFSQT